MLVKSMHMVVVLVWVMLKCLTVRWPNMQSKKSVFYSTATIERAPRQNVQVVNKTMPQLLNMFTTMLPSTELTQN